MKIRLLSSLLISAFLIAAFSACSSQNSQTSVTEQQTSGAISETEPAESKPLDRFDGTDYDDYNFRVLCMDSGNNGTNRFYQEVYVESATGDVIDDAVVTRNTYVEDKLNIVISAIGEPESNILKKATTSISAGEDAFDMVNIYKHQYQALISQGLLRDWLKIPVWDSSKPWWNSKCCTDMQVKGHLFGLSGSILISDIDDTLAMVFNKSLAEQYNTGNIYDMVNDGSWTLDKMCSIVKGISVDLDGDGKYDEKNDLYGYMQDPLSMTLNWIFACDIKTGYTDEDGQYNLDVDIDKMQNVIEKMADLFKSKQYARTDIGLFDALPYFEENRIFIYAIILRNVEALRSMDIDFGIIPYPKYNDEQNEYYTHVGVGSPVIQVPITNTADDQRLGTIVEALCELSHDLVLPSYYEVALKTKISRDSESGDMLDLILAGRRYEFSYYYNFTAGGVENVFRQLVVSSRTDFASELEKKSNSIIKNYQSFLDTVDF